jgi:uncharacterized protein (DUF2384 family)
LQSTTLIDDAEAQAAYLAVRLVGFGETIHLVPASDEPGVDREQILAVLDALAKAGVGRKTAALQTHFTAKNLATVLGDSLTSLESSPLPELEWAPMTALLGDNLLSTLVGVSLTSLHRYRSGERPTPDHVASRLHFVALVVADLTGSYNDFGVRRWFDRPRAALGGRAPSAVLAGDWSPDDEAVRAVRELAKALLGPTVA